MQPSLQDFINGVDLSNVTNPTGVQLNQEVYAATPYTDKGLIMWTIDVGTTPQVPAAQTNTKWQLYLWGRIQPTLNLLSLYGWNPNAASDPTYLQWVNVAQGVLQPGAVTSSMIANGTITGANIAATTITDALISTVGGSKIIAGTIPISALIANTITAAYIANDTITNQQIATIDATAIMDNQVMSIAQAGGGLNAVGVSGKIKVPAASGNYVLAVNAGSTQLTWLNDLFTQLSVAGIGTAGQLVSVNAGATALQFATQKNVKIGTFSATTAGLNSFTNGGATSDNLLVAHGLGAVPSFVRVVMLCTTSDAATGYVIGDEIELNAIYAAATQYKAGFTYNTDNTNVYLNYYNGAGSSFKVVGQNGGSPTAMTATANFAMKIYAAL